MQRMSNLFFDDDDLMDDYYPKATDPFLSYRREIADLEAKLAESQRLYSESVDIGMSLAQASDSMKLQLIMSGALTIPEKLEKPEEFKQENPRDQFTAILNGIEGLASNAADGTCVDSSGTGVRLLGLIETLKKLQPYLKKEW